MCKADGVNWHANETRAASQQSWSHINTHTHASSGWVPACTLAGAPPHRAAQPNHPSTYPHTNNNTFCMIYLKLFFNKQKEIRWRTKGWLVKLGISLWVTRAVGVERDNCQMWKGLNFAVTATVCHVRTCIQLNKNWRNKNWCLSWGKEIFSYCWRQYKT